MKRCLHTLWGLVALLAGCADDMPDNSPNEPLELSHTTVTVSRAATTVHIGVRAREAAWSMTGSEPWCVVTPASGGVGVSQIAVVFTENTAPEPPEGEEADAPEIRTATFTFTSGEHKKTITVTQLPGDIPLPNEHADKPVNAEVFAEFKRWYYNGEPNTVDADTNQSYKDFYYNYLSHLPLNTFDGNIWTTGNERYLYSYIERRPAGTAAAGPAAPAPLNYGMEFELVKFDNRLAGRILYVEKDSPAARAGLVRGNWFYKVNDTPLGEWQTVEPNFDYHYQRFIDTLVHPIRGVTPRLGMLTYQSAAERLVDNGVTVDLSPSEFVGSPIFNTQIMRLDLLPVGSGRMVNTGYMMYNRFDPAYETELLSRFAEFRAAELDNFILDLRYNKSGTVEAAQLMGNLLVGDAPGVAGRKFADYTFHNSADNRSAEFASHPNGIGVDTVFVLTSPHTAGASELLINALRGLDQQNEVKLVVIGDVTAGMAAGMVSRTVTPPAVGESAERWEYTARMLAFRCYNAAGDGDYNYGFVPNGGVVSEWQRGDNMKWSTTWGWKGQVGSNEDALVKRAVDLIVGREAMPHAGVINADRHQRSGYPREFCFPTFMTIDD